MRKMGAKYLIVDALSIQDDEIKDELKALHSYFKNYLKKKEFVTKNYRLTFISTDIKSRDELKMLKQDHFLASAILVNMRYPSAKLADKYKNQWHSYIYKAIVCKPKILIDGRSVPIPNNFLHILNKFECVVTLNEHDTFKFTIDGTAFLQQNGFTSVCAHVAICMILLNMRGKRKFRKYTPEKINSILKIKSNYKKLEKGLNQDQIRNVFKKIGLKTLEFDFFGNPEYNYASYLYHQIEGGNPSLLLFTTNSIADQHVVPILGHTLNTNIWDAEAELFYNIPGASGTELGFNKLNEGNEYKNQPSSSVAWLDHIIIHDDNYGMYLNLPVDSLLKKTLPSYDWQYRAYKAISIVPQKVLTHGFEADGVSALVIKKLLHRLGNSDKWIKRMNDSQAPFIVRTLLVSKYEYKRHLDKGLDFTEKPFTQEDKRLLLKYLPKYFWLSEITLPDLYTANGTKLFEVIYSCDKKPAGSSKEMFKKIIQIRFTGAVFFPYKKIKRPISIKSHYPLMEVV